ncbi:hypothetical protein [Undibacterium sp. Xuan67W]|uniref:hypothetical protein n=1 Tax=Undibacterium sp. Xuan67W TaxID=3413057 RepID=UPI003BF081AF
MAILFSHSKSVTPEKHEYAMRDTKDTATLELPGFHHNLAAELDHTKQAGNKLGKRKAKMPKQVQLDLLHALSPVDHSGLPAWQHDENKDLSGLPIWR